MFVQKYKSDLLSESVALVKIKNASQIKQKPRQIVLFKAINNFFVANIQKSWSPFSHDSCLHRTFLLAKIVLFFYVNFNIKPFLLVEILELTA